MYVPNVYRVNVYVGVRMSVYICMCRMCRVNVYVGVCLCICCDINVMCMSCLHENVL